MLSQDSCAFFEDPGIYQQFKGVVLAEEEGKNISRALGSAKACLLQNHDLLIVGRTAEEAVFWFTSLEKCCHAQLLAEAAVGGQANTLKIDRGCRVYFQECRHAGRRLVLRAAHV